MEATEKIIVTTTCAPADSGPQGFVYHKLTAGPQSWFACEDTFGDVVGAFLSWGSYQTNYTPPAGCDWTEVIQNFNLTGSKVSG